MRGQPIDQEQVAYAVKPLFDPPDGPSIDIVVLACTHFPLIRDAIQAACPPGVRLIDTGEPVARQAIRDALAAELATFVKYQAFAIGCAVAMVSPRTIVLGGGILAMAGYPRELLTRLVAEHAPIAETGRSMDLRWAELGWASVLHGAPRVVAEQLARRPALPQP